MLRNPYLSRHDSRRLRCAPMSDESRRVLSDAVHTIMGAEVVRLLDMSETADGSVRLYVVGGRISSSAIRALQHYTQMLARVHWGSETEIPRGGGLVAECVSDAGDVVGIEPCMLAPVVSLASMVSYDDFWHGDVSVRPVSSTCQYIISLHYLYGGTVYEQE